jgi:hypothetical protein
MSIQGYVEWAERYATLFGFDRDTDVRMLAAWEQVFDVGRVSAGELEAATQAVAQKAPRFRSDHLLALQGAIRDARLANWRAEREREEAMVEEMRCVLCGWTGWVVVPHPGCIEDGVWMPHRGDGYYTAAVLCVCTRGRKILDGLLAAAEEQRGKRKVLMPMRLTDYERRCPHWQAQMEVRAKQVREERNAVARAVELDKAMGPLRQGLRLVKERTAPAAHLDLDP